MALTQQMADLVNKHPFPAALGIERIAIGSILKDLQNGKVSNHGFVAGSLTGDALRTGKVTGTVTTAGTAVTATSATGGLVVTSADAILFSVQGDAYVTNGGVTVTAAGEVEFSVNSGTAASTFTVVFTY